MGVVIMARLRCYGRLGDCCRETDAEAFGRARAFNLCGEDELGMAVVIDKALRTCTGVA